MVKSVLKTLLILFISLMFSCKSNKDNTVELLTSRLENSNLFFVDSQTELLNEFANLKHDPLRYINALRVEPLIDTLKKIVNSCNFSIDKFKDDLNDKVVLESVLSENKKLKLFLDSALLFYLFEDDKSLEYIKNLQFNISDSSIENKMRSVNIQVAKANITALQHGINFSAYKFIQYCNYKIASPSCF